MFALKLDLPRIVAALGIDSALARACSEGTAGCMEFAVDGCIGMTTGSVGINIIFSSVGITLEWGSIRVLY
jgi:hypothetical protein